MDFKEKVFEVRYNADNWGPFDLDCTNLLPPGTAISECTALRAFSGKMNPVDDMADFTETTDAIIDSWTTESPHIYLYFKHGPALGMNTIVAEVLLDNGAVTAFYFYGVKVT